jgi:pimeloyl-ACP methyl ester carboxylesterase
VFVGHSYGGLLARLFADRWPDEVAGVVLVDSSHPRQFGEGRRLPRPFGVIRGALPLAPWAARLGLMRFATRLLPMDGKHLPEPERSEQLAFLASPRHWEGVRDEMQVWHPETNDEAARTRGFGDAPLAVISADHGDPASPWARFQDQMAALSTNSAHETVAGASHGALLSDSLPASRVVAAIRAVREAAIAHTRVSLPPR